jgi:polyvinyl alcohol dehydrogenase (cytochrome)
MASLGASLGFTACLGMRGDAALGTDSVEPTAPTPAGDNAGKDGVIGPPQIFVGDAGPGEVPEVHKTVSATGFWPQMGYDERNGYFSPTEKILTVANAPTLEMKWRFAIPAAGFPPGTPIVADEKVYVMATGGTYAINLKDGTQAWAREDLKGTATMAYEDGFVFAHVYSPPSLYKLNAKTGKTVWGPVATYDLKGADGTSSPIIGGDNVYIGHSTLLEVGMSMEIEVARGGVAAVNKMTGVLEWQYFTVSGTDENGAMVWSSVGVDVAGGTVYAGSGNNYTLGGLHSDAIHAIDIGTGLRQWATQVRADDIWSIQMLNGPDADFGANPIIADIAGRKVVADGDKGGSFWVMDRETGAILWKRENLGSSRSLNNGGVLMNGAFDGKYFYVVSNQPDGPGAAMLHALDPARMGADAWPPINLPKLTWGAPSVANGVLVVPNDDDVHVFEAATGRELTRFNVGGTIAGGSAAIVDGKIVVQSGMNYMFAQGAKNNNSISCYGLP